MEQYSGIILFIIILLCFLLSQKKSAKKKKPSTGKVPPAASPASAAPSHAESPKEAVKAPKVPYRKPSAVHVEEKRLLDSLDRWDPMEEDRRSLRRRDGRPSYDPDITEQVLGIFH